MLLAKLLLNGNRSFVLAGYDKVAEYKFSTAKRADILEIVSLYHSLIGTPGCTWDFDYPDKEIVEADILEESLYVLRNDSNRIIAVAAAGKCSELDELSWSSSKPCDLARIGVLSEMQNHGIGTIILQNVMNEVRQRGFDGIRMLVSKRNPSALALYEKNGFHQCGETVKYGIDFFCYEIAL